MPIPAGTFQMGNDTIGSLQPVHTVNITRPFAMLRTEVTRAQWSAVMGWNLPTWRSCDRDDCPMDRISWNDVQVFLDSLNTLDPGRNYRLPTEAEWEYACRAGTASEIAGTEVLDEMGWYAGNSGYRPHPVARKQANQWGLYDMHGNVWEWVHDWHSHSYYSRSPVDDPTGPASGTARVLRGSTWRSTESGCSGRGHAAPEGAGEGGFRLVRDP